MPDVTLIYCPWDSGRKDWRCGNGPQAILQHGARDRLEALGAQVEIVEIEPAAKYESENSTGFEIQRQIATAGGRAIRSNRMPIVIAGNCNTAVGGISGIGGGHRRGHIWFDAHGDFCTPETTDSGFLDGMGLAMLTGRCWQQALSHMEGYEPIAESLTALVGARDLDPMEAKDLAITEITHLRVEDIRRNGVEESMKLFLARIESEAERLYIHVDLDVLDPVETPANQLNVPDGLWVEEVCAAIRLAGQRVKIAGAGFGSYDPSVDPEGKTADAAVAILDTLYQASHNSAPAR